MLGWVERVVPKPPVIPSTPKVVEKDAKPEPNAKESKSEPTQKVSKWLLHRALGHITQAGIGVAAGELATY